MFTTPLQPMLQLTDADTCQTGAQQFGIHLGSTAHAFRVFMVAIRGRYGNCFEQPERHTNIAEHLHRLVQLVVHDHPTG